MEEKRSNTQLRRERELKGWSQRTVAEQIGTNPQTVTRWELGEHKPSRYFQTKLCELFGKSAEELGFMDSTLLPKGEEEIRTGTANQAKIDSNKILNPSIRTLESPTEERDLDMDRSRRSAIAGLLGLLGITAFPDEWWEQLAYPVSLSLKEEQFNYFQQLLETAWGLCNGGEWGVSEQVLDSFLPDCIRHAPKQKGYAQLAAKGLVLRSILQAHRMNLRAMVPLCQQAKLTALQTEDHTTICSALNGLAVSYKYNGLLEESFKAYVEALCYCDDMTSPLIRSRIYAGVAAAFARKDRRQEADLYIHLAYEHFPSQPEHDPNFLSADNGLYMLSYYQGVMYLTLKQPQEALSAFDHYKTSISVYEVPRRNQLEIVNHQGKAAILSNDLERYIAYLNEGIRGALELQSRKRLVEVVDAFQQDMPTAWRTHSQIKPFLELYPFLQRQEAK